MVSDGLIPVPRGGFGPVRIATWSVLPATHLPSHLHALPVPMVFFANWFRVFFWFCRRFALFNCQDGC